MAKFRNEITQINQFDTESLYEAWERYKDLLRRCPHHRILEWLQIQTFYNWLNGQTQTIINVATGGALIGKTREEAYELLEEMASNNYQWPTKHFMPKKPARVHELDTMSALTTPSFFVDLTTWFNDCQCNPYSVMTYKMKPMQVLNVK